MSSRNRLSAAPGNEAVHLGMIADGHDGSAAAQFVKAHMLDTIVAEAADASPFELERAMRAAFAQIHEKMIGDGDNCGTSGCTCTVVAIVAATGELTCANWRDRWQ